MFSDILEPSSTTTYGTNEEIEDCSEVPFNSESTTEEIVDTIRSYNKIFDIRGRNDRFK
jgi:hypothetical protein